MICKRCGTENRSDAKFCRSCGRELDASMTPGKGGGHAYPPGRGTHKPVPLLLTLLIAVFALGGALYLMLGRVDISGVLSSKSTDDTHVSDELYYSVPDTEHIAEDDETQVTFVDNEAIVYLAEGYSQADAESLAELFGAEIVGQSAYTSSYQMRFAEKRSYSELSELLEELEADSRVEAVSKNVALELDVESTTGDPAWSDDKKATWGLRAINVPEAWDLVSADESIRVGIMDDQFYAEHEDLEGVFDEMLPPYDRSFNASGNLKYHGKGKHGTHVAGIIGARSNDRGSVGVAHGCALYGWSVIDKEVDKKGKLKLTLSYGIEVGLTYLIASRGCRVINMSFGDDNLTIKNSLNSASVIPDERQALIEVSSSLETAVRALVRAGYDDFVICKATGNKGAEGALADFDILGFIEAEDVRSRIIMVGSVSAYNDDDKSYEGILAGQKGKERPISVSSFSNGGRRVDIVAPGGSIYSTYYDVKKSWFSGDSVESTYEYDTGTSMATPMVSGVAALVVAANPDLKGDQIKQIICETADQGGYFVDHEYSVGLLDAEAAVQRALSLDEEDPETSEAQNDPEETSDIFEDVDPSNETISLDEDLSQIENDSGKPVVHQETMDYDGDGTEETYAIVGSPVPDVYETDNAWNDAELWFVSPTGSVSKLAGSETFPQALMYMDVFGDDSGHSFLSLENTAFGSGGTAHVYTVWNGEAIEVGFELENVDWVRGEGGGIVGTVHFDEGVHKRQDHWFVYDESSNMMRDAGTRGDSY